MNYSLNNKNSFYIVSTTCEILGLNSDCEYIQAFELVLDNYIKNTKDGEKLLDEYDLYGCIIANRMRMDFLCMGNTLNETVQERKNRHDDLIDLVNKYIKPQLEKMTELVKDGNIKSAILRYILLVRKLMVYYDIDYEELFSEKDEYKDKSIVSDTLTRYKSIKTR